MGWGINGARNESAHYLLYQVCPFSTGFCMPIAPPFLDDFDVDPETKRVLRVALEMTRISLGLADDLATESSPSASSNLPRPVSAIPIFCVKGH
jgi:hypothetical protein